MKIGFLRCVGLCLFILGGCAATKASFRLSLADRRIQVFESKVTDGKVELLVRVSDRGAPVTHLIPEHLFIFEDDKPLGSPHRVSVAPPPELYLVVLVDTSPAAAAMLPSIKWAIKQSLRHLTRPAQVRVIGYGQRVRDLSGTFLNDFRQVEQEIDSLHPDPIPSTKGRPPGGADAALAFGRQLLAELPSAANNITLAHSRPLYNSAVMMAGPLTARQASRLRAHAPELNLLLLHSAWSGPSPVKPQQASFWHSVFALFPVEKSVGQQESPLTAQIREQLNALTNGYHLISYQSASLSGQHQVELAFDLYGGTVISTTVDYGQHTVYHPQEAGNLLASSLTTQATSPTRPPLLPAEEGAPLPIDRSPPLPKEEPSFKPPDGFVVAGMRNDWLLQADKVTQAAEGRSQWYMQIAAFSNPQRGYRFLQPLSKAFKVTLLGKSVNGKIYYRCLVGPVSEGQKAALQRELAERGYQSSYFLRRAEVLE